MFTLRSGTSLTTGGGSGGGLGSEDNSRGVDGVGDVLGSQSADLVKRKEGVLELMVSPSILPQRS